MKKRTQELVLEVGAAGGSLSIWLVTAKDGTRAFLVKRNESALRQFMDKEDAKGIRFNSTTGQLHSFTDALIALGRYPWHLLYPVFVHQDFIDPVLKAVMNLGGKKEVARWKRQLEFMKRRGTST